MKEIYPEQFDEEGQCKFKFSAGQRFNQMKREGFSHRRTTTKKKKNLSSRETIDAITSFFLETRVFQRQNSTIQAEHVYNRDQVPMALAPSQSSSIDDRNKDVIQDSTYDAQDSKRFCSLNLTIPMELKADLSNLIRPHVLFKATKFIRGEDQTKRDEHGNYEHDLQDKRVVVSFQSNAQVDSETNLYGLYKAKPILEACDRSVQFEYNLSSHKTKSVQKFQSETRCTQILYPPDLTHVLQPIDRHIGNRYKTAVYKAIRTETMRMLRERGEESSIRMKPIDKRVLITKVIADTHDSLARAAVFKRSFLATGTQLPPDRSLNCDVDLHGVDFKYENVVTQAAVDEHQSIVEVRQSEERAAKMEVARLADEIALRKVERFAPAVNRANVLWPDLLPLITTATSTTFNLIASHIKKDFICAGSFPAAILASVQSSGDDNRTSVKLQYNDIDVYHGNFDHGVIRRKDCVWTTLDGVEKEVNLISCSNLNVKFMLENCDINVVAVFVEVAVTAKKVSSVNWTVGAFDQTLRSWQTDSQARTLVRLAYKSYQMGFPFDEGHLSPLEGELFASHKKKIE